MIGLLFVGWKKTGQDRKWIIQVFRGLQTAIFKMFWFITWSQEELALAYPNLFRLLWKSALPCSYDPLSEDSAFMLKKCTWQGNLVNCSDIFTPVITDSGVCCAFNHRSNLKDSMYSQLVKEMQGPRNRDDKEASTGMREQEAHTVGFVQTQRARGTPLSTLIAFNSFIWWEKSSSLQISW